MSQERLKVPPQRENGTTKRDLEETNEATTKPGNQLPAMPNWILQLIGSVVVMTAIAFVMWLVNESIQDRLVPPDARYLVAFVMAVAVVYTTWLFGGGAVLKGKLPFPLIPEAWKFEGQGAMAIFLSVFISLMLVTRPTVPQVNAMTDVAEAGRQYYQLIADDQCALAWERLSESFRSNRNQNDFAGYEAWCQRIDEANIMDLQIMSLSESFARVRFTIDFVTVDGVHDLYNPLYLDFSFVDGQWLIIDAQS